MALPPPPPGAQPITATAPPPPSGAAPLNVPPPPPGAQAIAPPPGAVPIGGPSGGGDPLDAAIKRYSDQYKIPVGLVYEILHNETGTNTPTAQRMKETSRTGAMGAFQLEPGTFKDMHVGDNPRDVDQNTHAGIQYLSQLYRKYAGDWSKVAAGYNMGPGALDEHLKANGGRINPHALPTETKNYIAKISEAAGGFWNNVTGAFTSVEDSAYHAVKNTLGAVDAILGAPQRLVSGTITGHGNIVQRVEHGVDVATHPFNEAMQQSNIEQTIHALHADRIEKMVNDGIARSGQGAWAKQVEHTATRVGILFGTQLVTDPLTAIPGLRVVAEAAHVASTANTASKAVRAVIGEDRVFSGIQNVAQKVGMAGPARMIKTVFGRRPELDPHLDPPAKAARLSIESVVEHKFLFPMIDQDTQIVATGDATRIQRKMDRYQAWGADTTNLPLDADGLTQARTAIGRAAVDKRTFDFLQQYGGWKGRGGLASWDPKKLTHGPNDIVIPRSGKDSINVNQLMADSVVGRLQKLGTQSVIGNPFPHELRNVGELQYLAGGPRAFGEALGWAAKGVDRRDAVRLERMGLGSSEYLRDVQGPLTAIPGARQYFDATQRLMNRTEIAYRKSLLDHYDRVLGPSKDARDEFIKADRIRRDLGDYRNASYFVRALQAIGGPFVLFRFGTVPAAVGRATVRNPQRVESIARTDTDINTDPKLMGNSPAMAVTGGPVEDASRVAFEPFDYLASPSSSGLVGQAYQQEEKEKRGYGNSVSETASQLADSYIPGYSALQTASGFYGATGLPGSGAARNISEGSYGHTPGVSALQEALYSLIGGYMKKRPTRRADERAMHNIRKDTRQ